MRVSTRKEFDRRARACISTFGEVVFKDFLMDDVQV
jgi:hypothetical protein